MPHEDHARVDGADAARAEFVRQVMPTVMELATSVELFIDSAIYKALGPESGLARHLVGTEVLPRLGRPDKIRILERILRESGASADHPSIVAIRRLMELRDVLAHGSLISGPLTPADDGLDVRKLAFAARNRRGPGVKKHPYTTKQISDIVSGGKAARTALIPWAIAD